MHNYPTTGSKLTWKTFLGGFLASLPILLTLTACGGQSMEVGSTPTETTQSFINAWEAEDTAKMQDMFTPDHKQMAAFLISGKLDQDRKEHGAIVKGQGKILKVTDNGSNQTADIAILYDNKCTSCKPSDFVPEWAPKDSFVEPLKLGLEKDTGGKWIVSTVGSSSYYSEQRDATRIVIADQTSAAQAISNQATNVAQQASYEATGTTVAVSAEETKAAIPTDTAVPTMTPTTVPTYLTAKNAYTQAGVADAISKWTNDAVLFRVYDKARDLNFISYNSENYQIGEGWGAKQEPYTNGDGTSRQWLFFVASPSKKQVRLIRVLDGKLDKEDVSAAYYRDLFAADAIVPKPLDINSYKDSDAVVKTARENGFRVRDVGGMWVQLNSQNPKNNRYESADPHWLIWGDDGKVIVVNPTNGEIIQNDF